MIKDIKVVSSKLTKLAATERQKHQQMSLLKKYSTSYDYYSLVKIRELEDFTKRKLFKYLQKLKLCFVLFNERKCL